MRWSPQTTTEWIHKSRANPENKKKVIGLMGYQQKHTHDRGDILVLKTECDWWCRWGIQRSWPACQSSATWTNGNHRLWLWSESDWWAATCPGLMNWQSIACWAQWHTRSSCGREREGEGTLVSLPLDM